MADNTLGTVQIIIRGDWSKLAGDFSAAEGVAVRFGASTAQGFNQASDGADKVVAAVGRLAGVIQQESAASSLAWQRNIATLAQVERSTRQVGDAAEHTVPQMAAASGAIRTAFGEQSIRAVERFITLIPGIGPLLQAAFPIIGAIAFIEAIDHATQKSEAAKAAMKELADATKKADDAFTQLNQTVDRLHAQELGRQFGPASQARGESDAIKGQIQDLENERLKKQEEIRQVPIEAQGHLGQAAFSTFNSFEEQYKNKIAALGQDVDAITAKIIAKQAELKDANQKAGITQTEQSGGQGAAQVSAQIAALAQRTDAARAAATLEITLAHQTRDAQIKAIDDVGEREIAEAEETSQFAQDKQRVLTQTVSSAVEERIALIRREGAEKAAGRPENEQRTQSIETAKAVAAARADAEKESFAAYADAAEAENAVDEARGSATRHWVDEDKRLVTEAYDYRKKRARESFIAENAPAAFNALAAEKSAGTLAKGSGQRKDLEIEGQKIALEGQYDQMIFKTAADKVQFAEAEAVLDAAARDAKLKGLEADLADAEAVAASVKGTEAYIGALERVAALKNQVADLEQTNANAATKQANQVQQDRNQANLGFQIGQDVSKALSQTLPQSIGGALASGIFDNAKGKDKGQEIAGALTTALKNTGKQLFGEAMSQALKQVISAILTQTGLQAALNALFPTVQTAQTAALLAGQAASTSAIVAAVLAAGVVAAFAEGGRPAVGMASIVGEKGPELFIPDSAGTVVPAGKFASAGINLPFARGNTNAGTGSSYQFSGPMHFHGVQNVRDMMRGIADYAKSQSPQFSAWSS